MDSGIIKHIPAIWVAIAVAARAEVPNTPIIIEATANIPVSDITITPFGLPIRSIFFVISQSNTHQRSNGCICLNGERNLIISPIIKEPTKKQMPVERAIPINPKPGIKKNQK